MKLRLFGYEINIYKRGVSSWHLKPEHQVKIAFSHNGIDYYTFVDPLNMYARRYFAALDAIAMHESGLDKKFVNLFFEAAKEYFNKGKHSDLMVLIQNLWQRSNYVTNDELFLTICSVVFFDQSENPYDYNIEYAEEKKNRWRRDSELLGKLWQMLPPSFLPSLDTSKMSISEYLKAQGIEELTILKYHLGQLSKQSGSEGVLKTIESRIAELLP
jgi:hypothetical protein